MRRIAVAVWLAVAFAGVARAGAQTQVLIVSGLGGEPRFTQEFADLSQRLAGALHGRYGVPDSDVVWLGEAAAAKTPHFGGVSNRENIEAAMRRMAARAMPGTEFALVLIGHGSGSLAESRISLPGPDLTAADFARLLAPFAKQRVAVLDLTSASGDALPVLSAPGRIVITATKSSFERNESHFAGYFVDALTKDGADADKDGRVSLLEAFQYAVHETERFYADDNRLQTEHAQLDDDGDKQGTGTPAARSGDGVLAQRYFFNSGSVAATVAANDPRLSGLYARRTALTDSVQALEARKPAMAAAAYGAELERLLIALARTGHAIRSIEPPTARPGNGRGERP